jgi:hypothetical protein
MVAGRINQPHEGEQVIATGQADAVAMTRAMICDPLLPNKAAAGLVDEIRACIGCNQACIGHFHAGYPISCIQHPETGRERLYGIRMPAKEPRNVMVVGGGVGGMKAAVVAAERGHRVTMYEASKRVGGQVLLAEQLPGRAEFGGAITNLVSEVQRNDIKTVTGVKVDADFVNEKIPLIIPVAFVSEHSETLVELDMDYKELAEELNAKDYIRIPALNSDAFFIKSLAEICKNAAFNEEVEIFCGKNPNRICPKNFTFCPNQNHSAA